MAFHVPAGKTVTVRFWRPKDEYAHLFAYMKARDKEQEDTICNDVGTNDHNRHIAWGPNRIHEESEFRATCTFQSGGNFWPAVHESIDFYDGNTRCVYSFWADNQVVDPNVLLEFSFA